MISQDVDCPPAAGPLPFDGILRSWIAAWRLEAGVSFCGSRLSAGVLAETDGSLVRRLGEIAGPTLLAALDAFRALPAAARLLDETPPGAPRAGYAAFEAEMIAKGSAALSPWPVLARLLRGVAADWDRAIGTFARHLAEDDRVLRRTIPGWRGGVPPVTGVAFGLSDPHGGGRTVGRIRFADGTTLAYKPRGLAVEAAFGALLAALSADGRAPHQRVAMILDRGDHGWMEWIAPAPCRTAGEAAAFYRRCGGLLALIRALRGGDIHPDNLIAAGAYPVIVDLECLIQPSPSDLGSPDPLLDPQMFQAGILPVWTSFDGGGSMRPVAAAGVGPIPMRPERRILHAGTDWMHAAERPVPAFDVPGPTLDGQALDLRDHAGAVTDGYGRTLAVLADRHAAFLAKGQPIRRMLQAQVRFLAAPTNLYALLLDHARSPALLTDAARFQAALNRARGRPKLAARDSAWQAVLAAEAASLARLDVPAFRYRPDRRGAETAEGTRIDGLFRQPIARRIEADLAALTPEAISAETAQLAAALRRPAPDHRPDPDATPAVPDVLCFLVDRIADLAVPVEGGIGWIRMWEQMPAFIAPAGPSLCYGVGGTAVALAAAARALDSEEPARLARRALAPWRQLIRRGEAGQLAGRIGPGWGRGLGGMIAAFVWCAARLDDPGLLEEAVLLAAASPAALRAGPGVPDVLEGAAGLALGLAVLGERRPDPALVRAMAACGRVILDRSRLSGGLRDCPDRGRPGLAGLSHGAGGIAAALASISAVTGADLWANAAAQALAYEDTLYAPDQGNWRHLGGGPAFKSTWCHGAPGIALARQCVADLIQGRVPDQELFIRAALETVRRSPIADVDDLCCGEAGRIAVMAQLAAHRSDETLRAEAGSAVGRRLPDWAAGRVLTLAARAGAPDDPSLYRGLGGLVHLLAGQIDPAAAAPVLLPLQSSRRPVS